MKKFKGGLYADLSNYNATLPNTEILLNFFKLNPIGYKSGGMVRGIAGGNPTGMRVTGGFLANAQKFAVGDAVSAYYRPFDDQPFQRTRFNKQTWRPGKYEAKARELRQNILPTILQAVKDNPMEYGLAQQFADQAFEQGFLPVNIGSNPDVQAKIAKNLNMSLEDVKQAISPSEVERKKYIPEEQYVSEKKLKEGQVLGTIKGEPVLTALEQEEMAVGAPEGWDLKKEMQLMKEGKSNQLHPYTQALIESGQLAELKPPDKEEIKSQTPKWAQGMLDQGITGIGAFGTPEVRAYQEKIKEQKSLIDVESIEEDLGIKSTDKKKISTKKNETNIIGKIDNEAGTNDPFAETKENIKNLKQEVTDIVTNRKKVSDKDADKISELAKKLYGDEKTGPVDTPPAWALPLMVAGFTWAASDNPDIVGAAAEGGIAGISAFVEAEKQKTKNIKDKLDTYFKIEDVKIRKDQLEMSDAQFYTSLETNTKTTIAKLEADILNKGLDRNLSYEQLAQTWAINESDLLYKYDALAWDKLSKTLQMKNNGLIANAQIKKLTAEARALGNPDPKFDTFNIDGKDVRVSITKQQDGSLEIKEIGRPSTASTVLKTFMDVYGTTIANEAMMGDEFDSNKWARLYKEFKKMVASEQSGIKEEDKTYSKIKTE